MLPSISWKVIWVSHRNKITTQIKECEYSVYLWSRVMIRFMWIITNKQYSQIYLFSLSYTIKADIRHYTKKTCFRKCCFYSISFSFLCKCLGRCRHSFRFSWYTKEGKQIDVDKWYIFATQTMSKALKLPKLVLSHSFLRGSC